MSSIWNSDGSSFLKWARIESKFKNIFNRSKFSPVTLEIWNIGQTLAKMKEPQLNIVITCKSDMKISDFGLYKGPFDHFVLFTQSWCNNSKERSRRTHHLKSALTSITIEDLLLWGLKILHGPRIAQKCSRKKKWTSWEIQTLTD